MPQKKDVMKEKSGKPVSLGDIAKAANVSRMTVSMALRNHPAIRLEVRRKIAKIANELGYIPDARMAHRMEKVRESKKREYVPIAWIDQNEEEGLWRSRPCLSPYLNGAKEQCEQLGYQLQEFRLKDVGMSTRRLSQILFNRGIQGIIVAPPNSVFMTSLDLNWDRYAAVTFGKSLATPRLHCVVQDIYYNMMLSLRLLHRVGYRRIGVLLQAQANRRSRHLQQAAVGYFHSTLPKEEIVPPLEHDYEHIIGGEHDYTRVVGEKFPDWLKKYRPDVIVGEDSRLIEWLGKEGYRVPEDIGVVHLSLDDDCLDWAGIFSKKHKIGAAAANTVISLVQNHQFGPPEDPMEITIQGLSQSGKTLLVPKPQ
ncbi:LacI family DNA-binding transcriptional regulator [Ruficoccus sp. ZRK36]|uniref:LacI family DNA-binding transcriptional regulator n=1 Tax=Ruficoccus sp. ZRK36 TaxID=2866311 RepID=UPI001C72CB37|nr:LacI family DNA-binding transcriptional regulator [Ruficoccus sp. ZRK36]QYY37284.1 LacI family transcriptional regulator [Ruficoccus sp. ZRK36]